MHLSLLNPAFITKRLRMTTLKALCGNGESHSSIMIFQYCNNDGAERCTLHVIANCLYWTYPNFCFVPRPSVSGHLKVSCWRPSTPWGMMNAERYEVGCQSQQQLPLFCMCFTNFSIVVIEITNLILQNAGEIILWKLYPRKGHYRNKIRL